MRHRPLGALVALAVAVAITGCGLKGPLYLPEKPGEIVIRPAPAAADPAAPSPPAAETQPPSEQPQDPPDGPERG
jgi:predicted small lipoprotein YifL